jgi:hypothetical protein
METVTHTWQPMDRKLAEVLRIAREYLGPEGAKESNALPVTHQPFEKANAQTFVNLTGSLESLDVVVPCGQGEIDGLTRNGHPRHGEPIDQKGKQRTTKSRMDCWLDVSICITTSFDEPVRRVISAAIFCHFFDVAAAEDQFSAENRQLQCDLFSNAGGWAGKDDTLAFH